LLSRVTFWGVIRALQPDINICFPPRFQLPSNKGRSAGPGRSWCLLSITGFSPTKCVTVCFQPGRAEWLNASLVYIDIKSLVSNTWHHRISIRKDDHALLPVVKLVQLLPPPPPPSTNTAINATSLSSPSVWGLSVLAISSGSGAGDSNDSKKV
jgi:hypothetical protein